MPDGRFVWITEVHLEAVLFGEPAALDALADAWDAAPADPAKAVLANRRILYATGMDELMGDLRALGLPSSDETTG